MGAESTADCETVGASCAWPRPGWFYTGVAGLAGIEGAICHWPRAGGWGIVETNAHEERLAELSIGAAGFPVFLPVYQKDVKSGRKVIKRLRPVFHRYLFVRFDRAAADWPRLFSVRGVRGVMCHHDASSGRMIPSPVPDQVVAELLARQRDGWGAFDPVEQEAAWQAVAGMQVKIKTGAFNGFTAVLESLDESGKVTLLLSLFGGTTRVITHKRFLQAA